MNTPLALWLRHETRNNEERTPIVPEDARRLVAGGVRLTVEDSPQRVFPAAEYAAVGCEVVAAGSWVDAPADTVVVGLKELPDEPGELRHQHVLFGHAFKRQPDAAALLGRFSRGGGTLLDLEALADENGRRLTTFGYWAGYVGASLGVLLALGELAAPLRSTTSEELAATLEKALSARGTAPTVLVTGALGRCGRGSRAALAAVGLEPTCWDIEETRQLDRAALLAHDVLVNDVYTSGPATPFVTPEDVENTGRRLATIVDVTCDAGSPYNVLPIYDGVTEWGEPARRLAGDPAPLDLIAIDNLPSLLPREASAGFSESLTPLLADLSAAPWQRCRTAFRSAMETELG